MCGDALLPLPIRDITSSNCSFFPYFCKSISYLHHKQYQDCTGNILINRAVVDICPDPTRYVNMVLSICIYTPLYMGSYSSTIASKYLSAVAIRTGQIYMAASAGNRVVRRIYPIYQLMILTNQAISTDVIACSYPILSSIQQYKRCVRQE